MMALVWGEHCSNHFPRFQLISLSLSIPAKACNQEHKCRLCRRLIIFGPNITRLPKISLSSKELKTPLQFTKRSCYQTIFNSLKVRIILLFSSIVSAYFHMLKQIYFLLPQHLFLKKQNIPSCH